MDKELELALGLGCLLVGILDLLVVRRLLASSQKKYEELENPNESENKNLSLKIIIQFVNISGTLFIALGLYFLYKFQEYI